MVSLSTEDYKKYREILLDYAGSLEKRQKILNNIQYLLLVVLIYGTVTVFDNFEWGWLRQRHKILSELVVFHDKKTKGDSFRIDIDSTIEKTFSFEPNREFIYQESRKNLIDTKNLEQYKYLHDRMLQDALRLKAPILGFTFDINNFPLFLGISLSCLLYLITFQKKVKNELLKNFSKFKNHRSVKDKYLEETAKLKGLEEDENFKISGKEKYLSTVLFIWALIIQGVTFYYTCKVSEKRSSVDPTLTCIYIVIEFALLVAIFWMVVVNFIPPKKSTPST